jgi:hypothetical protein
LEKSSPVVLSHHRDKTLPELETRPCCSVAGNLFQQLNLPGYSHILETRFLPGLTSTANQVELRMEYQSGAIIIKRQV